MGQAYLCVYSDVSAPKKLYIEVNIDIIMETLGKILVVYAIKYHKNNVVIHVSVFLLNSVSNIFLFVIIRHKDQWYKQHNKENIALWSPICDGSESETDLPGR
jgi:hypothetical protein